MASTSSNVPLSEILRSKPSEDEDEPKKKSREDWRKAKELEEARKAGTAPAAVDEHGRDINPHIPQYISAAPWYFGSRGPTLQHQRIQPDQEKEKPSLDEWYKRGVDTTSQAKKFRKGACDNCGALTHKKKDCLERPRKVLAKYSNAQIACDEFVQPNLLQDYDSKRDRWAGYDPSNHKAIVEHYQKIEEAKRELRADKLDAGEHSGGDEDKDDEEEDEDKYVDEVDMPGTKVDSKQRITVRNLRIREDTAKYLRNLDPNSAYYDPKTRSMRDNPYEMTVANPEEVDYAGENFVRFSGDTRKHATAQLFAWEAYEKGVDVHVLAEPTKLELLKKEYEGKKEEFKAEVSSSVIDKYGGAEHLKVPPKQLLLAQTEDYVEYSRYGKVIKGQEKVIVKSRYEEDVYPNNHTSIWGSWWHNGVWGYKCCHSFIKNSYCTGEAGVANSSNMVGAREGPPPGILAPQADEEEESRKQKKKKNGCLHIIGKNKKDHLINANKEYK
uniref:Pre-mRNA-splicing factor SLU7 n=1 Tax=Cacopsylla melanoneura TaxID=428564 RepID=A0A8D8QMQ7_9HEMI